MEVTDAGSVGGAEHRAHVADASHVVEQGLHDRAGAGARPRPGDLFGRVGLVYPPRRSPTRRALGPERAIGLHWEAQAAGGAVASLEQHGRTVAYPHAAGATGRAGPASMVS
jgi:hypothetical protein